MSRIILVHGWTGRNNKDWFPWAIKEFTQRGYGVIAPAMPEPEYLRIEPWVTKLKNVVGTPRSDDIYIGHSIGCQAIERYLLTLPDKTKIDRVILVAPWVVLTKAALDDPEQDNKIVKPWYETPIDYQKIKGMANCWYAIFSNNDPWVAYKDNVKVYRDQLGAKIILEKEKGHFTTEDGVVELHILLSMI